MTPQVPTLVECSFNRPLGTVFALKDSILRHLVVLYYVRREIFHGPETNQG
jgi:hypothetical protein